jgi:protein TonB
VLHALLIALAIRATGLTAAPSPKTDVVQPLYLAREPAPPQPAAPTIRRLRADPSMPTVPRETELTLIIDEIPETLPRIGSMSGLLEGAFEPSRDVVSGPRTAKPNVADDAPLPESMVEKAVVAIPGTATPRYPSMLQSAGLEGDVRAQFVVDTLGRVQQGSFRVLQTSHDLFAAAVREAMSRARFTPAEVGGRKVRQLVEQSFTFRISR